MILPAPLAIQAADRLLAQESVNLPVLQAIALRCRQIGSLDRACRLYERLLAAEPGAHAEAVVSTLRGRGLPPGYRADTDTPVPFVRLLDFLPGEVHSEVLRVTAEALGRFTPSLVNNDGHERLDTSRRVSAVLKECKQHADLVRPYVSAALEQRGIGSVLGVDVPIERQEIQVTCSGRRAFFKPHTDSGVDRNHTRRLTFVYYFHFEPKQFTGGNLLLFDSRTGAGTYTEGAYTGLEPLDNSIVFFPSQAVHEVETVNSDSDDLRAGRFTINGWVHA
jgi:hypothetical protein